MGALSSASLKSSDRRGEGGGPGEIIGANKDQKNTPLVPYFLENACHPEEEENAQASPPPGSGFPVFPLAEPI